MDSLRRSPTVVNGIRLGGIGAEDGNRTRIAGLEGQSSTIELLPHLSERPDSNRRPQRPERCALTKLRHSPMAPDAHGDRAAVTRS